QSLPESNSLFACTNLAIKLILILKKNLHFLVHLRVAASSGLLLASLGDQSVLRKHAWLGTVILSAMASFSAAQPLWLHSCLKTRQQSNFCMLRHTRTHTRTHTHTHTLTHSAARLLFLNQMCFYWVQFRFPRHYKYAQDCSECGLAACRRGDWLHRWQADCLILSAGLIG
ncbi:hypothetical protein ILYODFUR_033066, partial [Ilyodon furcidens]